MLTQERANMLAAVVAPDRRLFITNVANGTHTLEWYQTSVYITSTASFTETLTLPPVAEAAGLTYYIRTVDTGGHTTIQDQDDSLEWSNLTTDADGEYTTLYCDGRTWVVLITDM